ncbi:MAG: 16S rRNA (cytidine(1402)-2'-O)-methyltransferase [Planctomycetota bacterium]|nr:16S rRNA (cytidine(1402)-2'-O)-methyltransferase [Planctomycetota bacterium]
MPLLIVPTPIGNLKDITRRAVEALAGCDVIACEDTRTARRLLAGLGLPGKPTVSYGEHNEARAAGHLLERLRRGEKVALISEGGTPLVSDPGYRIVAACRAEGIPVIPLPGPCAAICALSASGLPVHAFLFRGFPPKKPGPRARMLADLRDRPETLIFYIPANRLVAFLVEIRAAMGDRPACVAREITKLHEDIRSGPLSELIAHYTANPPRGECTVLIRGNAPEEKPEAPDGNGAGGAENTQVAPESVVT